MNKTNRFWGGNVGLWALLFYVASVSWASARDFVEPGTPYDPSMERNYQGNSDQNNRTYLPENRYQAPDSPSSAPYNQRPSQYNQPSRERQGYGRSNGRANENYYGLQEGQSTDRRQVEPYKQEAPSAQSGRNDWYNKPGNSYKPPSNENYSNERYPEDRYREGGQNRPPYSNGRSNGRPESYGRTNNWNNPDGENSLAQPQRERLPLRDDRTYSSDEILGAGHQFFGKVTEGLAKVIQAAFARSGRPVAFILGEEGSGAIVAGLRYGEGVLHTKYWGKSRIYWQGPSIGYDFGANGNKTLTLVYNLQDINQIYGRFGGVTGSAYVVGGIGITLQKKDEVTLAPIRSGVGLRLGANVGYLKYTRRPTWNPF